LGICSLESISVFNYKLFLFSAKFDWVAAYESSPKQFYVVRDVGYVKTAKREAKLDFRLMQYEL